MKTFLFPRYLGRLEYLVRWVIFHAGLFVFCIFFSVCLPQDFNRDPNSTEFLMLVLVLSLVGMVLRCAMIDIPRLRSMGLSPWLVFLFAIPLLNMLLQLLMFFDPEKFPDTPPPLPS